MLSITNGVGKGKKPSPLRGCFLSPPLLPAFRRLRRPQTPPCRVKNSSKPSSRGLELRTPPSWEEKLVAQDDDGPGDLVHTDVDWMCPPLLFSSLAPSSSLLRPKRPPHLAQVVLCSVSRAPPPRCCC